MREVVNVVKAAILVIDDNEDISELLALMLRRSGYRVFLAGTGEEGLATLAAGTLPNLILLDVQLPDMTGPEVLDRLEEEQPEVLVKCEILFYTAGKAPADSRVAGSLNKMFEIRQILAAIAQRLPGAQAPSPPAL